MPQAAILTFHSERLVVSFSDVKVRGKKERSPFSFSLKMFFHYSIFPLSTAPFLMRSLVSIPPSEDL